MDHVGVDPQEHDVFLMEQRGEEPVPGILGDLDGCLLELLRGGFGVVVHPVPHRHVDQGHGADLAGSQEIVQGFHRLAFGCRGGESEKLQVAALEHEGQRFRERGVGDPAQKGVVD